MAITTTLQKVEALYIGYFGRAGDPDGTSYWINKLNSGFSLSDAAASFSVQPEAKAAYAYLKNPTLVSPTDFVTQVYQNLFNRAPDDAGKAYWVAELTANQGNPAYVGNFILAVINGAYGAGGSATDVATIENKVAAGSYFTEVAAAKNFVLTETKPDGTVVLTAEAKLGASAAVGSAVTSDAATVDASKQTTDAFKAPALTDGVDHIVGTAGNDIINAGAFKTDGTSGTTLNAGDTIDGGLGVDTLVVDTTDNVNQNIVGTITNVENLTFLGNGNAIAAVDATPFSGTIKFQQTADTTVSVNNVTGQTLVLDRVADGTALTVAAAAAQASLTLKAAAVAGDATFSVSGAALKTVNLAVDKTVAGKSVTVTDTGNTTETANIAASGASSVTVTSTALKAVTVTGAGAVALTAAAANSIDASGNTGGVTLAGTLVATASFTGGAGKDSVTVGATTKAISMGAGDDTVNFDAIAAGMGGSIDGGEGIDTIALSAANAVLATANATAGKAFADSISNFEKLSIGATAAASVVDAKYIDGITHIISAGGTDALTINNLAANSTFETTAENTGAITLALADATGTADVLNLKFAGAAGYDTGAITAAGVETLNIATLDTDAAATAFTSNITAAAAKSVVITGNAGLDLSAGLATTTLTSLDASGVTGTGAAGAVSYTSGALAAAATVKGGAGNDVLNLANATKTVTVDGGAGDDTITGSSTVGSTLSGGDGIDTINGGAGADTINGGAGNDIISGGEGLDILTGGAGNDIFNLVANSNGNIYATIMDATAGDTLSFTQQGTETFDKVKVSLAETAVFQDYLNEAAKANGSTNGNISWFQWSGNTYVVEDISAENTFVNGSDTVVKLAGLIDLSGATLGDHAITLV